MASRNGLDQRHHAADRMLVDLLEDERPGPPGVIRLVPGLHDDLGAGAQLVGNRVGDHAEHALEEHGAGLCSPSGNEQLARVQKLDKSIKKIIFQVDGSLENPDDQRTVNILNLFPEKKKPIRKLPKKQEVKMIGGVTSKILNPKYTLDNFVVGQQNRLAHAACSAVANQPGKNFE